MASDTAAANDGASASRLLNILESLRPWSSWTSKLAFHFRVTPSCLAHLFVIDFRVVSAGDS
ncbi:MAG: hypothetical protein Q7U16_02290 [Agitococcus sp.]|nr:hypothetical protein [Agitococcus sp.]